MSSFRHKLHHFISGQIPDYIRENYPIFVSFVQAYYLFLEETGEANDVLLNTDTWMDIDQTLDDFIPLFQKQYMGNIPQSAIVDIKRLIKFVNEFYEAKGSENGTELFFRFMFNDTASVKYPGDNRLVASGGNWKQRKSIKLDTGTISTDNNPFLMKGRKIFVEYTMYENGVGNVVYRVPVSCLDVVKLSAPNIYRLDVELSDSVVFPDTAISTHPSNEAETVYDSHLYVLMNLTSDEDMQLGVAPSWSACGTLSKQLVSIKRIVTGGTNFRVGESFYVNEGGTSGEYFEFDVDVPSEWYTLNISGTDAYVSPSLMLNNAIVRVRNIISENLGPYFAQNYTVDLFETYTTESRDRQIRHLQIVTTGQRFSVREYFNPRYFISYSDPLDDYLAESTPSYNSYTFPIELLEDSVPVSEVSFDFYAKDAGEMATVIFNTGYVYVEPGRYVDSVSLLSEMNKLQDNFLFQPYSYTVKTHQGFDTWKDAYTKSNHPAGFILFANLNIDELTPLDVTVESVDVDETFVIVSATPSVTPTPSITLTPSVTPSVTPSITRTPSVTASVTPTPTRTPSITVTPSITPTVTVTPTRNASSSVTPTVTPSITRTPSVTPSITPSITRTPSVTPSITASTTPTVTPTATRAATATPSVTPSITPTVTRSVSVTPSITPSITPSVTRTPSVTPSITRTPSVTPSITPTVTPTRTTSATPTPTPTPTVTPTPTITTICYVTGDLLTGPGQASSILACALGDTLDITVYTDGALFYSDFPCSGGLVLDGYYKTASNGWIQYSGGSVINSGSCAIPPSPSVTPTPTPTPSAGCPEVGTNICQGIDLYIADGACGWSQICPDNIACGGTQSCS